MSQLKGQVLALKRKGETIQVYWKQGAVLGFGGDRSQSYTLCVYELNGSEFPAYIQTGFDVPQKLTIDSRLQYGVQEGVLFFVYHDKEQTIYQHRFRTNSLQKLAYGANEYLKTMGVDLSWVAGDYLRNI